MRETTSRHAIPASALERFAGETTSLYGVKVPIADLQRAKMIADLLVGVSRTSEYLWHARRRAVGVAVAAIDLMRQGPPARVEEPLEPVAPAPAKSRKPPKRAPRRVR